jgi:hypothetical protein
MRSRSKVACFVILVVAMFLTAAPSASAWNSHGACTAIIIEDQRWLDAYRTVSVTEWTYADVDTEATGPNFTLRYLEGGPGTVTSASAILANYADEPDWYMDTDLSLSAFQALTGGSQGWRHQYYGLGWLRFGSGPARAQYFYDLAVTAKDKGDLYWTFRYLARSMHYVQDLTQQYHSVPAPIGIILKNISNFSALVGMSGNHHYNMEEYQGLMVARRSPAYLRTLRDGQPFEVTKDVTANWLGRRGTWLGRPEVRQLWPLENTFFGVKVNSGEAWLFDKATALRTAKAGTPQADYDTLILTSLERMSGYTRTLLQIAREGLSL